MNLHPVFETPSLHVIHQKNELWAVHKHILQFHDLWMLKSLHDLRLLVQLLSVFSSLDGELGDYLHCQLLFGDVVCCLVNSTEAALPNSVKLELL